MNESKVKSPIGEPGMASEMNVIEIVSNRAWGGGERYALDLSEALRADGANVVVATRGIEAVDKAFSSAGFPLIQAPLKGLLDFRSPRILARYIKDNFSGLVTLHVHNFKDAHTAVRVKKISGARIRVVLTRHLVKKASTSLTERPMLRSLDTIVFVSQTALDGYFASLPENKEFTRMLRDKSVVIPNAVKREFSLSKSPQDGIHRLSYIGRLSPEKGLEMMFEALSLLKDTEWLLNIVGTGEEKYVENLRSLAEQLKISSRINWKGYLSDTAPVVAATDIGLFPSLAVESFGLTVLEFMKGGAPVVSTDTGAQKEIITDGKDGVLTKPDPQSFAAGIRRLLNDSGFLASASEEARKKAAEYSYPEFYRKIKITLLGRPAEPAR